MKHSLSLTQKAGQGALWQMAGGGWQTMIRLGASVFLARALTPMDFGIYGMALLMREFLNTLGALNMGSGIIARRNVSEDDLSTCFWSMAGMRLVMFLIAFFAAPLAAWLFGTPGVADIVRVISFSFLISILGMVPQIILSKRLRFQALNIIRGLCALVESILAVLLALYTDLGYWALVIAMMVNEVLLCTALFFTARWKPSLRFDKESFRYLFRYGINGLGFSITNYLKQNLDYLLVGRLLGPQSLGLYEFAYRLPHLVHARISRPVAAVVFPALSKVQDDDSRLIQGYLLAVKYVCLITFPLLFGLAAVADVAVPVLWGDQWLPIIAPLRLLCLCAALRMIPQSIGAIFKCRNRPDLPFKISLVGLGWTALVVCILGYYYGLMGVALGMVLSVVPGYFSMIIAFRMVQARFDVLFKSLNPVLISSIACGVGAYVLSAVLQNTAFPSLGVLISAVAAGALVYFLVLLYGFPEVVREVWAVGEEVLGKRLELKWIRKLIKTV